MQQVSKERRGDVQTYPLSQIGVSFEMWLCRLQCGKMTYSKKKYLLGYIILSEIISGGSNAKCYECSHSQVSQVTEEKSTVKKSEVKTVHSTNK